MATPFHLEVLTPERVLYSGDADEVSMRTDGGEISFLARHEDYIGAVAITVVRVSTVMDGSSGLPASGPNASGPSASGPSASGPSASGPSASGPSASGPNASGTNAVGTGASAMEAGSSLLLAVHGGFVHVDRGGMTLLAGVAELAVEIDVERARAALDAAEERLAVEGPAMRPSSTPDPTEPERLTGAMVALLSPESAEAAVLRARVRLEAAGATHGS